MQRSYVSFWPPVCLGRTFVVNICISAGCYVFGRDEGNSEFSFTQQQVDTLIQKWSQIVRADGWGKTSKPSDSTITVVQLSISDKNKSLLLANSTFIPYVLDALLLVRAEIKQLSQCTCGRRATAPSAYLPLMTIVLPPSTSPGFRASESRHDGRAQGLVPATPL